MTYALLTFIFWGLADLYYKKSNTNNSKYSHLVTGIIVGLVMGIHATFYLIINNIDISVMDIFRYLPVSLCYILSMIVGYKGLKYIELSISSPIQNSSGIVTILLLCIFFKVCLNFFEIMGIIVIVVGIFLLSIAEIKEDNSSKIVTKFHLQAVIFPIIYTLFDGMGTFLDAIYLDKLELISENAALISYEYTFLVYGIASYIYLTIFKKEKMNLFKEKEKLFASFLETTGQFTYVFAVASNSVIAIPIVSSYSILSVLLSKIFLKENLNSIKYVSIIMIFAGILILSLIEVA